MVKNNIENVLNASKGQTDVLTEPQGCIQIPTHQEEMDESKKQTQKPNYIVNYLMYAEKFAQDHFSQDKLKKLKHYEFKQEDFDPINKQNEQDEQNETYLTNKETRNYLNDFVRMNEASFQIVKSYTEFVNIKMRPNNDSQHFILIKTWELVSPSVKGKNKQHQNSKSNNTSQGGRRNTIKQTEERANNTFIRSSKSAAKGPSKTNNLQKTNSILQSEHNKNALDPSEQSFYIKTIKIYDQDMDLVDEILVEQIQISGKKHIPFYKLKNYNTSILTNNDQHIYYYKRIYDDCNQEDSSNVKDIECSNLKLFKYDLSGYKSVSERDEKKQRETICDERYTIKESVEKNIENKYQPVFHHVMFSKMFGTSINQGINNNHGIMEQGEEKSKLENQFLNQQYILLTRYLYEKEEGQAIGLLEGADKDKWLNTVKGLSQKAKGISTIYKEFPQIRSMYDLHLRNEYFQEIKLSSSNKQQFNESINGKIHRQLIRLSHSSSLKKDKKPQFDQTEFIIHMKTQIQNSEASQIKGKDENSEDHAPGFIFFISDLKSILQITVPDNLNIDNILSDDANLYRYNCNQKIKLFNQEIQVQSILLDINNDKKKKETCNQFFFIDQRNNIQLVYPNHKQKVQQQQIIKFIQDQSKISAKYNEFCYYKRIQVYEDVKSSESGTFKNYFQPIDHLNKIVKDKTISQDNVLSFVCNPLLETLIITDIKNPSLIKYIQFKQFNSANSDALTEGKAKSGEDENQNHELIQKVLKDNQEHMIQGIEQQILYNIPQVQNQAVGHNKQLDESKISLLDFSDTKIPVQCYDPEQLVQYENEIKLVMYQRSNHKDRLTQFIFSISDKKSPRKNKQYIFVSKKVSDMTNIFNSRFKEKIINDLNDEILLFRMHYTSEKQIKSSDKQNYLKVEDKKNQSKAEEKSPQETKENQSLPEKKDFILINLVKILNKKSEFNAEIETKNQKQDGYEIRHNAQLTITPQSASKYLVIKDRDGFGKLQITRSSDVFQTKDQENPKSEIDTQLAKYIVVTYFKEQLGKIQLREYLIRYPISQEGKEVSNKQIQIQNFGMRQIFFSKQMLYNPNFNYTDKMHIIPFHNEKGSIKGCQMIWWENKSDKDPTKTSTSVRLRQFNMFDQENNNIYTYQSQIINGGVKRQLIKDKRISKGYIVIVSASIKSDFILKNKFDNTEIYSIIWLAQNVLCNMKVPTLENILLKSFEVTSKTQFFVKHEFLYGKSLCDICIQDPFLINDAIQTYDIQAKEPEGSAIISLCQNDRVRKKLLKKTGAIKDVLLIGIDLNFNGSIFKAIELKALKSIQYLFDFILKKINTVEYQKWFMFDLKDILYEKGLDIYDFFERSDEEKLDKRNQGEFCNIEQILENNRLPPFSNKQFQSYQITQVQDCTNFQHELINKILEHNQKEDQKVDDNDKNLEVEHSYINYQFMIMGEKIKNLKRGQGDFKLTQFELSSMMNGNLLEFYSMETIQDIIQIQWNTAKKFTLIQFRIYYLFFALPYCINLLCNYRIVEFWYNLPPFGSELYYIDKIKEKQDLGIWLTWIRRFTIKINIFPQFMLLFIECVQIKSLGLKYFFGWNIIDISQIMTFFVYAIGTLSGLFVEQVFKSDNADDGLNGNIYLLKLSIFIFSWMKMIFYFRTFESYGLLIQMAIFCIQDLTQFISFYFLLLFLFTCCFYILGEEVYQLTTMDGVAQNLPYFVQLYLFQYQTSLEYLYVPHYNTEIFGQQPSNEYGHFDKPIRMNQRTAVFFLWVLWFLITWLLNILMINFIVAVIINSYEQVKNKQRIISFRQRADLNQECYEIGNVLEKMGLHRLVKLWMNSDDQFKIIVMTTSKDNYEMREDSQVTETGEKLTKFMKNQNHQIIQNYQKNKVDLKKIDEQADNIQQMIETNFDQMGEKFKKMSDQIKTIFNDKKDVKQAVQSTN